MDGISIDELREIGSLKGILSVNKYESKVDLIRTIQLADGHEPCFAGGKECPDDFCMWVEECISARADAIA